MTTLPHLSNPCSNYPCPRLATGRNGLCGACQRAHDKAYRAARAADPARDDSFYRTPEWKRLRKLKLEADPLCVGCHAEHRSVLATTVDHILPIALGGAPLDWGNLQSMCTSHHNAKTARERRTAAQLGRAIPSVTR